MKQMPDASDMALVRQYARGNSEPAFAELVCRHINLVYSVALRYTGQAQDAEDVTQAVFIILARKADGLRGKTILTGWLYEVTRFTAMKFLRTTTRRRIREQEAYLQSALNDPDTGKAWQQVGPLLEEAMTRLGEKDRLLLALRFFENKSGAKAAALLGMQEWAARKRMERAVEKLRLFFDRRGVKISADVLTGAISANSVQAAPVALAKSVTAVAMAKGAAASGSTLTLIKGALKIMAWTKVKTAIIAGAVVVLAVGTTAVIVKKASRSNPSDARAFYNSAMKHYMAKEYEAELLDLNKAIKLDPQCGDGDALFSRACLYSGDWPIKEKDEVKAVADYSRLLDFKTTDVSAWHNRALCYEQLHEYDKAIADYTTIIEGNMDYSHLVDGKDKQLALDYHYRGRAYQWYKKDYLKAIADYDEALRLDPKIEMVHQHRAQCYEALKQFDKVKEDFEMEKAR